MKNYYETLQVNKTADKEIIQKVYKILTKKYHPDLQQNAEDREYAEKAMAKRKEYYKEHYKPTVHYCQVCGEPLPDGRQTYCLRCLVSTYMTAEQPYKQIAYNRLALRGYDKAMILDEAKRMNIG
jgi:hypothetical protein